MANHGWHDLHQLKVNASLNATLTCYPKVSILVNDYIQDMSIVKENPVQQQCVERILFRVRIAFLSSWVY